MRAGMRREDDVRQILERRIDERLLLKGVQTQTAELLGMTQVQVSRREKKILMRLREQLTG